MKTILIIAVLLIAAFAIFIALNRKSVKPELEELEVPGAKLPDFYARKPLTEIEQAMYHLLVDALPMYIVLAQVQVSQLVGIKKGPAWQTWFNKISRKSVDYLICAKDFSIVATIELDDSSHDREDRQAADADKNTALAGAKIKLIRWQAKALPNADEIRSAVHS